jgi:TfoX/Sxy family transcriptional regulator of competence genes
MTFDEDLARRLRTLLPRAEEKSMFGGIGLMEHGRMVAGVLRNDLIVRVPPEETEKWLTGPGVLPMMAGRRMKGWVKVAGRTLRDDDRLSEWVRRSQAVAKGLGPKAQR